MAEIRRENIIDQLRQAADDLERAPLHALPDGVVMGSLAVALGSVQQNLDRTPSDLQDRLPDEPEVVAEPEVTSRDRLLLTAANLGMSTTLQDICDAQSLVESRLPGGDRAVIRRIQTLTGRRWSKDRQNKAIKLADAYRTGSADTVLNPESDQDHPVTANENPVVTVERNDTAVPEDPLTTVVAGPIVVERDDNQIVVPDDAMIPETEKRELTLSQLREYVLDMMIEEIDISRQGAKDLLSHTRKVFTDEQTDKVEGLRLALYAGKQHSDSRIKKFCNEQKVSAAEMRRLALFLGMRLHRDNPTDRTEISVSLETPHPVGRIRSAAAQNGHNGGPDVAERDLLNGLEKLFSHLY